MAAPRALTLVVALVLAACTSTPAASPLTSPSAAVDPAAALQIASPYELERPSASDLDGLSGNIRGLSADLAESAGAGYAPADFPMGFRFVRDADEPVGVVVLLAMPAEVAETPGLLEPIAAAVAAEVNAVLSYETIQGVKVGVVRGPIASTIAVLHGHLVMAQSGQPAVDPKDLMTAVIAANEAGFADGASSSE